MPQNTNKGLISDAWTQLTDANVTRITFQNVGTGFILVKATATAVAPTNRDGALRYNPGQGERAVNLADLFPGVTGATRLWAYSHHGAGEAFVSHE